ncbi:diacylglycerol kinase [Geomonas silvestris]|uniref:Diacylglycerol kinase n=1 Tax=Geomonas silvestris TaxID=2740184 RepID=A0A6V8MMR9_9BACT|nr:diacylglycerol kinase family protein [Geomonas silvestris]GFO61316.1 diacylglycerol kinase [Geomonas silvestris]
MPPRCHVIVNPTSGSFSKASLDLALAALRETGLDPLLLETASAEDPARFAARICAEEAAPLILVMGGDGTLNGVLNGLRPGVATLGVLPLGTANVLARELKIRSLEDALGRIARAVSRPISVGELECAGVRRRFLLMAGVGVDGQVVRGVRLAEKRLLGKGAYLLSALRVAGGWERGTLQVTGAGRSVVCHSVIVCNAARYGGDFLLAPEADLFSPGFQVLCIEGGPLNYLKLALKLGLKRPVPGRFVTSFAASEVTVAGDKPVQLDGDYFGVAPLTLRSLGGFVRVIC